MRLAQQSCWIFSRATSRVPVARPRALSLLMSRVDIELDDEKTLLLWTAVGDLADGLPTQWVLIGGLMVQLHTLEHGVTAVRPTRDIDVLGQARPQGALTAIDRALRDRGFEPVLPDLDGYAHRYERDGVVVDLLAPEGIKPPPRLAPAAKPSASRAALRPSLVRRSSRWPSRDAPYGTYGGASPQPQRGTGACSTTSAPGWEFASASLVPHST